jgi:hypothetical protein
MAQGDDVAKARTKLSQSRVGRPAPPPSPADQVLAPFQTLLCQRVKEGQCTRHPMLKGGAAKKLGRPTTLAGRPT